MKSLKKPQKRKTPINILIKYHNKTKITLILLLICIVKVKFFFESHILIIAKKNII